MANYRIDRRGTLVTIFDDPDSHTHQYFGSIKEAIAARKTEFEEQIKPPFTMILEYDEGHDAYNVMTKNPASTYGKGYRPIYKKRPAVFIKNASNVTVLFDELGIEYV